MLTKRIYGKALVLKKELATVLPSLSSIKVSFLQSLLEKPKIYNKNSCSKFSVINQNSLPRIYNPLRDSFTNSIYRMRSSMYYYTTYNWRGNYINDDSWELFLSKRILLVFGAMVRKRRTVITFPVNATFTYSISDICGHTSFLFLAFSYLENDFLYLRMYAMSGLSLSIIFQFYRERPLWIPIRWNFLFLLINAMMIIIIMKEQHDANNLPTEQKKIYDEVFKSHGMKLIDFLHLMSISKRHEIKRKQKLVELGRLSVKNKTDSLPSIKENQFVGCLSFLTWEDTLVSKTKKELEKQEQYEMWDSNSVYSMLAAFGTMDYEYGLGDDENDIASNKQMHDNVLKSLNHHPSSSSNSNNNNNNNLSVLTEAATLTNNTEIDGIDGQADVVCEVDGVVYSWEFSELRELLLTSPSLNLVFEHLISLDLNKKFNTYSMQQQNNYLTRYKDLVSMILSCKKNTSLQSSINQLRLYHNTSAHEYNADDTIAISYISDSDRLLLAQFRQDYDISKEEHIQILQAAGWTEEQFEIGRKAPLKGETNMSNIEKIKNYYKLVQNEISNKTSINQNIKLKLMAARQKLGGIDIEHHIKALQHAGWSYDEYENMNRNKTIGDHKNMNKLKLHLYNS